MEDKSIHPGLANLKVGAMIDCLIFLAFVIALYLYLNKNADYWKVRKVPYVPPVPILGNLKPLVFLQRSPGHFTGDLYNCPQAEGQRFLGIFIFNNEPALLVRDPELVKNILVKDFNHFSDRNVECDEKCDPVGVNNLFCLRGPKWKYLRSQLTPTFTSGKMKQMFHLIKDTATELLGFIEGSLEKGDGKPSVVLEAKATLGRYTIDVISTCAFGLRSNSIGSADSVFEKFGNKIFSMSIKRALEVRSFFFMHWLAKTFQFVFLQKESTRFFRQVFWETLQEREKNGIARNDFLDVLIKLKNDQARTLEGATEGEDEIFEFKGDLLLAQPILFFTAGFETTSTVISLTLYELALQPDIQERLRREISDSLEARGGELTYEGLFEMKYLDMVVSETLRKYPPMPFIDRICTMDYKIPDSDVVIRKGTPVFISLFNGLHYDESHFPMPEKYDPERFDEETKQSRHPFSYIPFGEGPHICIGKRFGLMNVKTALSFILTNYRVDICEKTEIPLEMDNRAIVLSAKNGIHLRFVRLQP